MNAPPGTSSGAACSQTAEPNTHSGAERSFPAGSGWVAQASSRKRVKLTASRRIKARTCHKRTGTVAADKMIVLAGSSHPQLAHAIAQQLQTTPCDVQLERFPDGEIEIEVRAEVRNEHVF